MMNNVALWSQIETDLYNGVSMADVCRTYSINPDLIMQARIKGDITATPKRLTFSESKHQRELIRRLNPADVVATYMSFNSSLKRTTKFYGMSLSKANTDCIKEILLSEQVELRTHGVGAHTYSEEQFKQACSKATSLTELSRELGLSVHTINNTFKRLIKEYDVDITHWSNINKNRKYSYTEIFCKDSKLARTMIRSKVLQYKVCDLTACSLCSTSVWLDKPLRIQVDHIDGDCTNNEVSNLRGLCPNCHSQTETYGGKRRK